MTPLLLLGVGRMGGAMIEGWRRAGTFSASEIYIRDPNPGPADIHGMRLNPPDADLAACRTVLLAVKPQVWREAAAQVAPFLDPDAVVVSIAAGVAAADIADAFGGLRVARVMPTTAVAINQGTASVCAADPQARARAHALFDPLGKVVEIADEDLMHAATAVSGSGPAYLYAFAEALEAAGIAAGLGPEAAATLARSTLTGAAALMASGDTPPAELRRQVTSPGGTTQAALEVLMSQDGLEPLLKQAVAAAVARSRELG
ncbi:MAG: pyrroline-5-carboxylate reductase [Caulobacter sp.]|jgi:pyrroline-5-carboxylate reductase|nr:pyrroline-5-carboxylate reductase [Caulobacter sp.]